MVKLINPSGISLEALSRALDPYRKDLEGRMCQTTNQNVVIQPLTVDEKGEFPIYNLMLNGTEKIGDISPLQGIAVLTASIPQSTYNSLHDVFQSCGYCVLIGPSSYNAFIILAPRLGGDDPESLRYDKHRDALKKWLLERAYELAKAAKNPATVKGIAEILGISRETCYDWIEKYQFTEKLRIRKRHLT